MILSKSSIDLFSEWREQIVTTGAAVLIDKDLQWTSFDAVAKLRSLLKIKKIGHAGTLDPLATGLLIICLGKFTKKIDEFQAQKKVYTAEFKFGATTKSCDAEFEEENICDISFLNSELIKTNADKYIGEIDQTPPDFSARKVAGKALYKYARSGAEMPEIKPKRVEIINYNLISFIPPIAKFKIECSKGVYIRSLARDLGNDLKCGAYLTSLRRDSIGDFNADDALKISEIIELTQKNANISQL